MQDFAGEHSLESALWPVHPGLHAVPSTLCVSLSPYHHDVPLHTHSVRRINTRKRGIDPQYGSFAGDAAARHNRWAHLVSDIASAAATSAPIQINQDANIHVAELDAGVSVPFELKEGRQGYLLCMEGSAALAGSGGADTGLEMYDAAELTGPLSLMVSAGGSGAHVLLVEMEASGEGRTDL